jgi:predicted MPP superfamily phosphohydrolase
MVRRLTAAVATGLLALASLSAQAPSHQIRFVFTSDAHYGITRPLFRGRADAPGSAVNAALVAQFNTLTAVAGPVDFLVEGGDIANRSEAGEKIQPAAVSWAQFTHDYLDHLTVRTSAGAKTPVYVVPGNHDVSNAIGYEKPMQPAIDRTSMTEIYNLMMAPARVASATYDYATDRVLTSRDIDGVHFVFLTIWPDAIGRAWLARDLERVTPSTPVVLFTHDPPDGDPKHFSDMLTPATDAAAEPAAWEAFVSRHPNVAAYFHGHSNWNEFYDWTGPRHSIALHTFRVDSPMKGKLSQRDETKLSFQVATIDTAARTLTVRECLWNTHPNDPSAPLAWGTSATVNLVTLTGRASHAPVAQLDRAPAF